jgi:mitogen-activated protein kinase kinase kinase 9
MADNLVVSACWYSDPHRRPSFEDILQALDAIVHSAFTQTPHESFHTMQEDWKLEIEQVLHGLRMKEKVYLNLIMQDVDINRQFCLDVVILCVSGRCVTNIIF